MHTSETRQNTLLDPDFLRKLEGLSLVAKRVFPGRMKGDRRSPRRGSSVEFADYRNYTAGDDFRRVDWNVYARLEKLFLKLFVEEEDLFVYLLVDTSRSMDFGDPSKLIYAKRLAAALAYIALNNLDRVGISALAGTTASKLSPKRGKHSAVELFDWLGSVEPAGETKLAESIRDFSLTTSQTGLVVVISDFLDAGYREGLLTLLSRRFEVIALHLLDQDEVDPPMVGDLLMIDSETGARREITISQSLLRKYRHRLDEFCGEIEGFCTRHGCSYIRFTNRTPFEDLVLTYLRRRGTVK